ncbi:Protein of unknown function [Mariniphaga anaerophila]|uniref:DUF2490 domain-containing protein n=1 Tax=Mariniphaga anaerophila TaxID=1484053 RepID=A0A1M4TMA6_9BACT|nr:DUF2490 domain-containing protein [Mariniphaga anaerophila]SHE45619.1 Protein of unknown function [Mariniphaga anaerophila]
MKRITLTLLTVVFFCAGAFSQRIWLETAVSAKVVKNLEVSLSPQMRFKEEQGLDQYFFDTGLEYKFNKFLAAGASYRLGNNITGKGNTKSFGRFAVDAKTGYDWKKSEIQFRLRYTNANDFDSDNQKEDNLRFRLKYEYNIKKLNLKPAIICELYRNMDAREFNKARYEAGLDYKISKTHRVGTFFRVHDYLTEKNKSIQIIGLTYKLKL